jgi:hypothetical protein
VDPRVDLDDVEKRKFLTLNGLGKNTYIRKYYLLDAI